MPALQPFLIALQFLTRLPVRLGTTPADTDIGRSVLWYPVVGALIGSLLAILAILLNGHLAPLAAAALLLVAWVLASGGLHLDGLADSTDAWAGGRGDRERMLAIMKDPYCGPLGATALILALIVKFAALATLATGNASSPMLLAPLLGRMSLLPLFMTTDYVRPHGLGAAMHAHLPRKTARWLLPIFIGGIVAIFGTTGILSILAACTTLLLLRRTMQRHIGGMTGDTAGALVELTECTVIVTCAALTA